MRAWLLLLLLALQRECSRAEVASPGCSPKAENVTFNAPKAVFNAQEGHSMWSFQAQKQGLRIAVTPLNASFDPDIQLYGLVNGSCRLMLTAQDYGGDFMVVPKWASERFNVTRFYVHVNCRKAGCTYHLSMRIGDTSADGPMPISLGETKSSLAYRGEPLEYVLDCGEECDGESESGMQKRLTISAWPRDATSRGHLSLLVRKDKTPSTSRAGHLKAQRGWFSGEVVSTPSSRGKWFITVLKKHGNNPLPFLLSATLPKTLQELPLGKPTFGAAAVDTMAFYKFEVTRPDTDIEVYMTVLSGDADIAISHGSVNPQPTPLAAQWKSRTVGDDELIIKASDPKRKAHPTGWFHVGVHGYQDSVFSIIALAEATSEGMDENNSNIIVWTELWLGLPQSKSVSKGRTARFLFYNQLVTPSLYVHVEERRKGVGQQPDVCMASCSPDVHYCPYMSPLPGERASGASVAVSTCSAAKILAGQGGSEATVRKPCTNCWYSILATTQDAESHFRLVLGADGHAHPLVAGEAFLGNVDVNDSAVELVFDLTPQAVATRQRAGAVLRAVLTTVYGDPSFQVAKDDKSLFRSDQAERTYWELAISTASNVENVTGPYYFTVWAASMHSQFRLQVFWENALGANALPTAGSLLGLPKLPDGKVVRGAAVEGKPDVYLFQPGGKKDSTISLTALGKEPCQLAATIVTSGEEGQPVLNRLLEPPVTKATSIHLELGHHLTYGIAQTACSSKAMRLCYGSEVCPNDELKDGPVGKAIDGDHWVPIKDDKNEWIQVGANKRTCWSHNGRIWPGLSNSGGYGYPQWGVFDVESPYKNHVFCCEMTEPYWLGVAPVAQARRYRCYSGHGKAKPLSTVVGDAAQNPLGKDYCETACNQEPTCMSFDYELQRQDAGVLRCRLYGYTEVVAESDNGEHEFCQLEDLLGLPLDHMVAWFKSSSVGLTWQSSMSEHVGKVTSGFSSQADESGHGSAGAVKYISGTTTTLFDFGEVIYDSFTICSVSRYSGAAHGRVITAGSDWLHGHWQDSTGVARYGEWATPHHEDGKFDKEKKHGSEDWIVMCGTNRNQSVYVDGWNVATNATLSTGRHKLQINDGVSDDEKSDWAVMEVVTWSRPLSPAEMQQASEYLMRKLQVVYVEHLDKLCKGSYLLQDFEAATTEICSRKCRDIGSFCTGFTATESPGKCNFFTGHVSLEDRGSAVAAPNLACWLPKVQQTGDVVNDAMPRVWRTQSGEELLNLRSTDPQALSIGDAEFYGYAVAVLPATGSARLEYELEAVSADVVAELPATGVPVSGRVSQGAYRRYRVAVLEAGRHLAISLLLISGDADLYVGLDATVARGHSNFSAEVVGSDSIFIPAFGALNAAHCSKEAVDKSNGECVYFVAVRGSSAQAQFRLSATIPSGAPVAVSPGSRERIVLPKGMWQYFYISLGQPLQSLGQPLQSVTFQVSVESGAVSSIHVKVTTLMKAQRPGTELADFRDHADFTGRSFAGVWSARMNDEELAKLCQPFFDAHRVCAAFVAVEARQALYGEVLVVADGVQLPPTPPETPAPTPPPTSASTLPTTSLTASSTAPPQAESSSTASPTTTVHAPSPPRPSIVPLEAGVPTRGTLVGTAGRDVLAFAFLARDISESTQALYVVVTPLTGCKPSLTVEFPEKPNTPRCEESFTGDEALGHVFAKIRRNNPCFGAGMYELKVHVKPGAPECVVDVRAQLQESSGAAFDTLMLDAPILVSDNRTHFFMFTSRIDSESDAASRDRLTVRISSLAGALWVDSSFLRDTGGSKQERLQDALRHMRPMKPKRRRGALAVFAVHRFHDRCGSSLVCQVLLRVSSVHHGGFVDYQAVATDDMRRRYGAETLLPGLPVRGHLGSEKDVAGGHLQFQVFLNNPSSELVLRLSCGGDEAKAACKKVILSADSRADFPKHLTERRWVSRGGNDGALEIRVNPYVEQSAEVSEGSCHVPCVLFVRVESQPGSEEGRVDFELLASEDSMYKMLLDGNDARSVTAQPSRPEYFLFDSRQRSPLLTFIVSVPYDSTDPFLELVSMYILDCAEDVSSSNSGDPLASPISSKQLKDPKLKPSRELHRFQGQPNTRNQLVAFVSRVIETPHCYYRIAVISNRLKPVTFSIRAFDWHEGAPLPLGQPLQGMVGPVHPFSYRIETVNLKRWTAKEQSPPTVYLSLEVCAGTIDLRTATEGPALPGTLEAQVEPKPSMMLSGGVDLVEVNLKKNRWLQISARGPENGSYILLAEDPFKHVYLKPTPQKLLSVSKGSGTEVTLEWSPALLFGRGMPSGGAGGDAKPEAEYEVFYINYGNQIPDLHGALTPRNLSTPCGLYEELRRNKNAKRVLAKTRRRITLSDLDPHSAYVFNVVARSLHSGHSVAYHPYRSYVYDLLPFSKEAEPLAIERSTFWDDIMPVLIILSSVACLCYTRPCCKAGSVPWSGFELELPGMSSSRNSARSYQPVQTNFGSYAPPSIVGGSRF